MLGRLDDKDMSIFDSTYVPSHEEHMKRFIDQTLRQLIQQGDRPGACTSSSSSTNAQRNINCAGVNVATTKGQATVQIQSKASTHTLSKHQTQPPCRLPLPVSSIGPTSHPATDLNLNLITALIETDSGERIVPIYEVTNAVTEMPTARTRSIANQIAKEFTHAINNTGSSGGVACIRASDGIVPEPVRLSLGQDEAATTDTRSYGKCISMYMHLRCQYASIHTSTIYYLNLLRIVLYVRHVCVNIISIPYISLLIFCITHFMSL